MGNCFGSKKTVIVYGDYYDYSDNGPKANVQVQPKKQKPTYTFNPAFETEGRRGKSPERMIGRPMITEA